MPEKYVEICPKCGSDEGRTTLDNINKRECLACGTIDFKTAFVEVPQNQAHYYRKETTRSPVMAPKAKIARSKKRAPSKRKIKKFKAFIRKVLAAIVLLSVIGILLLIFL